VAEHFLYGAKVCAAVEHVGGEGVPEGMRGGLVAQSGEGESAREYARDAAAGESAGRVGAIEVDEERFAGTRGAGLGDAATEEPFAQCFTRVPAEEADTLFAALAHNDAAF